ncbi:short-chain dehydrogenase [Intrasporangium chromatireducens Q5-1]|uniref:Short-chain dehydrogenase n=1 Tax=Intrasporangium chromatireducens Q5-1 TaxID=584657 RepID=W9GRK6_9MICO|nr:SDR family oxidoreductase [Intrasporangium chromatireducens]EWT07468.1 short-chain dehydrogenase [Intrasporangium chromatireducens Q5-1]
MGDRVAVIIGVGPGVGASVARRFGRAGYDVALVARSPGYLEELGTELQGQGVTTGWTPVDIADAPALRAAVERFGRHLGRIDVLHYNPSVFRQADPLQLDVDDLLEDVRVGVGGLLTAVQGARPAMLRGARVLATGSMAADEPWNEACSLGVQKAALRNLVRSLDATLAPDGIRAMSLTVRGTLAPDGPFAPERVAEALYAASQTTEDNWQPEVPYAG